MRVFARMRVFADCLGRMHLGKVWQWPWESRLLEEQTTFMHFHARCV